MKIKLTQPQEDALRVFLDGFEDAEQISTR